MTIHPSLFPTLFVAALSVAAAAWLRRYARREYSSLMPWLRLWGMLCTFPALLYVVLCIPGFGEGAKWLTESLDETRLELLAGMAGVLPGLLWDEIDERIERDGAAAVFPFGLPEMLARVLPIIVLVIVILIPYGFLFNRGTEQERGNEAAQTETAVPVSSQTE